MLHVTPGGGGNLDLWKILSILMYPKNSEICRLLSKRQISSNETTPSALIIGAESSSLAIHCNHILHQMCAEVEQLQSLRLSLDRNNVVLCVWARNTVKTVEKL